MQDLLDIANEKTKEEKTEEFVEIEITKKADKKEEVKEVKEEKTKTPDKFNLAKVLGKTESGMKAEFYVYQIKELMQKVGKIFDSVISSVKHRADQLRKSCVATGNGAGSVEFERIHRSKHDSGLRYNVFARLKFKFQLLAVVLAEFAEKPRNFLPHGRIIHRNFIRLVRYFEAAAEIQKFQFRKTLFRGQTHQVFHALENRFGML